LSELPSGGVCFWRSPRAQCLFKRVSALVADCDRDKNNIGVLSAAPPRTLINRSEVFWRHSGVNAAAILLHLQFSTQICQPTQLSVEEDRRVG
jgi:hypothetical protein